MSWANRVEGIVTVVGIADAHGIESCLDTWDQHTISVLMIRSMSNRQRHAVVYQATMPQSLHESLVRLVRNGEAQTALKLMKGHQEVTKLSVERGWDRSWEMIPNPKLDPFWSPNREEVKP